MFALFGRKPQQNTPSKSYQALSDAPSDIPKAWTLQEVQDEYKKLEKKWQKLNEDLISAQPCGTSQTMWTAIGDHREAIEGEAKELKKTLEQIKRHREEFKSTFEDALLAKDPNFSVVQKEVTKLKGKVEKEIKALSKYARGSSREDYQERMQKLCEDLNAIIPHCFPTPSLQAQAVLKQRC